MTDKEQLEFLNKEFSKIESSVIELQKRIEINGHEIDRLQVELTKPKKWWANVSTILSIVAILLSGFATIYGFYMDKIKETSDQKARVKEIVKRISEIQSSYHLARDPIELGKIQQSTQAEATNLVDEAITICDINQDYLNDSEYLHIVTMSAQLNKTERLLEIINFGLKKVDDNQTEFGLRNQEADYYYRVKRDPEKGRSSIKRALELTENEEAAEDMKITHLAQEYGVWSSLEFQIGNYQKADSLLKIAEEKVILGKDSWKFENFPVTKNIIEMRKYLDNFMKSSRN